MIKVVCSIRYIINLLLLISITACGSGSSDDGDGDNSTDFSVQVTPTSLTLSTTDQSALSYTIIGGSSTTTTVSIATASAFGNANIDTTTQTINFIAGTNAGADELTLLFSNSNNTVNVSVPITVSEDTSDGDGDGSGGDGSGDGTNSSSDSTAASWPTDYITIYEDEVVTIDINRNYALDEVDGVDLIENFYLNAANLSGSLSQDNTQFVLSADDGEEDTYGELVAVTEYQGVVTKQTLQVIYYNKNRDLTTEEPPVIALIEPEISLPAYSSQTLVFDVYDPDSDRISYRITNGPSQADTHINRTSDGYELLVTLTEPLPEGSDTITLEVSDAYLIDAIDITINDTSFDSGTSSSTTNTKSTSPSAQIMSTETDQPAKLYLEENVTVSLIQELDGTETDEIARFAFVLEDENPEFVEMSASSSDSSFTFDFNYPYFSIYADDVTNLEDEQITLAAQDGDYLTKLTFHVYIEDNYLTFLGGNPNVAPLVSVDAPAPILESKSASFDLTISDFEQHDFTISSTMNDVYGTTSVDGETINVQTNLLAESITVETEINLVVTDVFGSARSLSVPIEIYKNTPPTISTSVSAIDIVETGTLTIPFAINDVDEGELIPVFIYDDSLVQITYDDGIATVTAQAVDTERSDSVIVQVEDEFGEVTQLELPLIVRIDNQSPVITFGQNSVEIAPGQSQTILLTYSDPDGTALTISRFTSDNLLTFSYNQTSGQLTLTLDANAEFQQDMTFTTTASDGFIEVIETLNIIVPVAPEPPILLIEPFNPSVEEGNFQIINYEVSDINGDLVVITTSDGGSTNIDDLTITDLGGSLRIDMPENIIADTSYLIQITATDDSTSNLATSQVIELIGIPENDAPEIVLSATSLELTNDYSNTLAFTISDIDNNLGDLTIEVFDGNFDPLPSTINISGLDIYSISLNAATKGTSLNNQEVTIRVTDPDLTSTSATFTVTKVLQNDAPYIDEENSPFLIDMGDNSSVNVVYYFEDDDVDPDTGDPEDTVSVTSLTASNLFGNAATISISNQIVFSNRVEFTINTIDVTLTNSADRLPVAISIVLTDGYVSIQEDVKVNVRDDDLP